MNKRVIGVGFLFLIGMIFLCSGILAANETSNEDKVNNAYACLKSQIDSKTTISFQEGVFGMLALGKYDGLFDAVKQSKSGSAACWPNSGCKLKDSAQVAMAYKRSGENNDDIISWLLMKNGTATDLAWYLEIDVEAQKPANCDISWGDNSKANVKIGDNMKITSNGGSSQCLSISPSGYLMKIKSECLDKTFTVKCTESFLTALIYQKNTGDNSDCLNLNEKTCYVSGDTHSAASLGSTEEKVIASCFKSGNICDYEGTLWATLAMLDDDREIDNFVPYILAMSEDNAKYFPDAFITFLTGDDVSYSNVISLRREGKYWDVPGELNNRFYETALGMLALGTSASDGELDAVREYLLSIQTKEGCWNNNNIKDTAFLLYSGWKKGASIGGGSNSSSSTGCLDVVGNPYSCESMTDCLSAEGSILSQFTCGGVSKCCSVKIQKESCSALGGTSCNSNEECSGVNKESSDGSCCVDGECQEIEVDQCTQNDGICKSSCSSGESEQSYSCSSAIDICCMPQNQSGGWTWMIIILILIILVVLGIIFRNKIQMWWFSFRKGVKSGGRPAGPGAGMGMPRQPLPPRQFAPQPRMPAPTQRPAQRATAPARSKELDETLRKLREMSK
ncbi:MAG: hypothetical protein AABX11_06340 [Nanoarchaeota archaeon]